VGEPIHAFQHIHVNEDRKMDNSVFYVLTGLSAVNDKIRRIEDRIEDINAKRKAMQEDNLLGDLDIDALSNAVADKAKKATDNDTVDILDTFKQFGI
jgi:hypothetical protein